jgi:serine phosphatase RsbU (regulator of sigma subunit)
LEHVAKITSPKLGNQFISAAFLHVDIETKQLKLLRAGHNPPLVIHPNNTFEELFPVGNVISNFSELNCQELNYLLQSGDIIVLYTDGITETRNSMKEMYGTKRLIQEIIQNRNLSSEKICQMVLESLSQFSGIRMNFDDDITLILLKIR